MFFAGPRPGARRRADTPGRSRDSSVSWPAGSSVSGPGRNRARTRPRCCPAPRSRPAGSRACPGRRARPRFCRSPWALRSGSGAGKKCLPGLGAGGAEIEDGGIQGKSGGHGRSGFRATGRATGVGKRERGGAGRGRFQRTLKRAGKEASDCAGPIRHDPDAMRGEPAEPHPSGKPQARPRWQGLSPPQGLPERQKCWILCVRLS